MTMPRLTERAVLRAKPRAKRYELSCSILAGFLMRVLPSGKKSYYVRFRDDAGKDRRVRLGDTTELSFDDAREMAVARLSARQADGPRAGGGVARGLEAEVVRLAEHPLARGVAAGARAGGPDRSRADVIARAVGPGAQLDSASPERAAAHSAARSLSTGRGERRTSSVPLLRDFAERFMQEHVYARLKKPTQTKYRQMLNRNVIPAFGDRRLDTLEFSDITRFHTSMRSIPYEANANLQVLSSLYSRAIEWGVLERGFTPPTRGVKKFPTKSRERFLTPEERATLEAFLERAQKTEGNQYGHLRWHSVAAIRLLALTGMRRDEVLNLTWDMVDYRHRCFRLPDSKTGQKVVPVSDDTLELVRECRRVWESCTHDPKPRYVIYSRMGTRVRSAVLSATWSRRVRDRIPGFEGVRLHDLRHSAASDALMAGVPLAVVGKILGHRRPETTARYAHIADSVVSDAVQAMSRAIRHSSRTGKRLKGGNDS